MKITDIPHKVKSVSKRVAKSISHKSLLIRQRLKLRLAVVRNRVKLVARGLQRKANKKWRALKRTPGFVWRIAATGTTATLAVFIMWRLCLANITNLGLPQSLVEPLQKLLSAKPQLQYITDLSAFVGVILAIAVPLGIDIVQKVSGFYAGSRTIRERLQREWQIEWMVPIYLVTVLLALTARFFFIEPPIHPQFERAVSYVLLALLFVDLTVFAWYLNRLYVYTLDQKRLKNEIETCLTDAIEDKQQSEYLDLIEAYGDIVVSEARSSNLKTLIDESLPFIENRIKQMVPPGSLDDAERFILSREFFDIYNKGNQRKVRAATRQDTNANLADNVLAGFDDDEDGKEVDYEQEAKMRLYFDPDRYMLVYLSTIQQVVRIYQEGINAKNSELTTKAVYTLIRLLNYFATEPDRGFYIELLLRRIGAIARQSATAKDSSMYSAGGHWYTTVAFDKYGEYKTRFQLEYLNAFDKELYSTLKFIVDGNHRELFASFVSYLVDGLNEPLYNHSVGDLGRLPMHEYQQSGQHDRIEQIIKDLDGSMGIADSIDQVRNWQSRLAELKAAVYPLLSSEGKLKADKLANELSGDAEEIYKHSNLRVRIFSLGAYCMFKKRYDFVKEIFDYKQPADSDAPWGGNDIQPDTVAGVAHFYFRRGLSNRDVNFWEGHHGSGLYVKRYFLCLLARAITRDANESFQLGDLTPTRLSDITYSNEGLKQVATELANDKELLKGMGLTKTLIIQKLIPLLGNINDQAKTKLSSIENNRGPSAVKVKEFREDAAEAHAKVAHIRALFAHYGKAKDDSTAAYTGDTPQYGLSKIDDKAAFFDEWYVSYGNQGTHYGKNLGHSESVRLYNELKDRCSVAKTVNTVEKAIKACKKPVILAPTRSLFRYEDVNRFTSYWKGSGIELPEAALSGFAGTYNVNGQQVPVFEVSYLPRSASEVLVVDIQKLPTLHTLSPLNQDNAPSDREAAIAISVEAFSSNGKLTQEFVANPPNWLVKVGDEVAQKAYLMNKVLIKMYERFELKGGNKKVGYVIDVKST